METFIYPANLILDKKDGGYIVSFPDFPEAITQGEKIEDAVAKAADCLDEAVANRIVMNLLIPYPSKIKKKNYAISLSVHMGAKAALYVAMTDNKITKVDLAKLLGCDEKEVRRLLNPRHPSKLTRIESALLALGHKLILGLKKAA